MIGSGLGGLCCAGLLARYGQDVLVLESHDRPGGAAHSFDIKGFNFDSGPSLFSGFQSRGPQANPLSQVSSRAARLCIAFQHFGNLMDYQLLLMVRASSCSESGRSHGSGS